MTRFHEVNNYNHDIVLLFVPKISIISTEKLPQGMTPCLFTTNVTENLPQGITPFLLPTGVDAALACLKML